MVPFMCLGSGNHNNLFTEEPPAIGLLSQQYTDHRHILFICWWNHSFLNHIWCLGLTCLLLYCHLYLFCCLFALITPPCRTFLAFLMWYFPCAVRIEAITTLVEWWIKMIEGSWWRAKGLPVHGALVRGPRFVGFYCLDDSWFFPGVALCCR